MTLKLTPDHKDNTTMPELGAMCLPFIVRTAWVHLALMREMSLSNVLVWLPQVSHEKLCLTNGLSDFSAVNFLINLVEESN